jgi:membrane protein implicated in regulation of membrane protease activity
MHIAILAGGVFVMTLDSPLPLLIILVLMKILVDLHLHKKSHTRLTKKIRPQKGNQLEGKTGISD